MEATEATVKLNVELKLDHAKVEAALRTLIGDLDYDIHKNLESDEESGEDRYPDLAAEFIGLYEVGTGE